ncbi:hypothetical protein JOF42_000380 [Microbacterium phyllosphaerae]|uniref:Uncharacterized protein n=1 Tax=Microbacterium phyllosphaerae TaxID=124798 RepID=A0ABS4WL08_9MICO|nr:hypothetical protein [Microbacterium phyllosphaerae]MBP2376885.1 hypothetical protein [Microbacterium phyllosphaerae]
MSTIMHAAFGTLTIDGLTAPFSSSPPFRNTDLVMTVTGDDLVIRTGVNMGPVKVDLERCPSEPEPDDDGTWDDVVEVVGRATAGVPVSVHGPTEMPPDEVRELSDAGHERVTMRIHAASRSEARDLAVSEPTER